MFHTSKIELTKEQAKLMNLPIIIQKTKGVKEDELNDLEKAIKSAIKKYKIQGITTGALHSQYQASRIQAICDKLKIKCINPLWHKDEIEYLSDLIKNKFKVIITHVAAEGLDDSWIGREIDKQFINDYTDGLNAIAAGKISKTAAIARLKSAYPWMGNITL